MALGIGMSDSKYKFGGGRVEIRIGSPKGILLGKAALAKKNPSSKMEFTEVNVSLSAPADGGFYDLFFVLKNENDPSKAVAAVDWVRFDLRE